MLQEARKGNREFCFTTETTECTEKITKKFPVISLRCVV